MNDHRHIIVEGEELYHYGIKGMKWKDHVYATVEKAGAVAKTSAKKVSAAASKFAKKANEMKERLTPAAKVAKGKAKAALKRGAKKAAASIMSTKAGKKASKLAKKAASAAKNPKKAIQDAKFESMKKRTEAARKPGKEPGMAKKRKVADARRNADLQVARENYVDAKSKRGRNNPFVYDSRLDKPARQIDKATAVSGTKNAKRTQQALSKLEDYHNDQWYKKQAAFSAKTRAQKVGKKKSNGR